MKDINEIHCADCGKFILTEEKNPHVEISSVLLEVMLMDIIMD